MEKRYQIFISSTYSDLKEERTKVMQTIMSLDCIPAGMELFPAMDEEQFEFIKRIIDGCDYYLLIVGARYGSMDENGVSYTEKEYDYAVANGIPVMAFLHNDISSILVNKADISDDLRRKLSNFRQKVETGRLVQYWRNADDLNAKVAVSLPKTIKMFPRTGWVKANFMANSKSIDHPYFTKWSQVKLSNFIEQNRDFFSGTHWTHPHAIDTFGIVGISYTKQNGTLHAVSSVPDYWDDPFVNEYLEQQRLLIREKNVSIQRIFVFPKENKEKITPQMFKQKDMGIDVRFIYSDDEFLRPEWLKEDFLIQDGVLLVQIFCDSHRFEKSNNENSELITINPTQVKNKEDQFSHMWKRAIKLN